MDEEKVAENVEIIIDNDVRVHIKWNMVIGKSLSSLIEDYLLENEDYDCGKVYDKIQPMAI
jgi:hypothetical protein